MESDSRIKDDVLQELRLEPSLDATQIAATVKGGVVTLAGQVLTYGEKFTAERAAKRVYGVRGVAEELEVSLPAPHQRTDSDIAAAAVSALKWHSSVPDEKIKVTIEKGWLTLEGKVDWRYQSEAAESAVRYLTGVRGVTNLIVIHPRVTPAQVKEQIHKAFERNAELDARRIGVKAHNGTVMLHGNVRSWTEREEAQRAVWTIPGVQDVENNLTVTP